MSSDKHMTTQWNVLGSDWIGNGIIDIGNGNKRPQAGTDSEPLEINQVCFQYSGPWLKFGRIP